MAFDETTEEIRRRVDIVEGTCLEGYFKPAVDKDGYQIFEPIPHDVGGNRIPPKN